MSSIVLKGKDRAFWMEHSELLKESMANYGTLGSYTLHRTDYPGSDENWELLRRVVLKLSPPLFIPMGDRAVLNPKLGYTRQEVEDILDYILYVPKTNSLAHYVKHRVPRKTRRERRVRKMTPQVALSHGRRKPRARGTVRTRRYSTVSRNTQNRPPKGPRIVISNNTYKKKYTRRHRK